MCVIIIIIYLFIYYYYFLLGGGGGGRCMYVVNMVEVFGFTRSTCKKPLLSTCSVSNTEQFRTCETFLFMVLL